MRILIVAGMIVVVTFAFVASAIRAEDDEMVFTAVVLGPVIGLLMGVVVLGFIGSKPRSATRRNHDPRPGRLPAMRSFDERLSQFADRTDRETSGTSSFQSKMPFWMSSEPFGRTPTKPRTFIRRLLERIRSLAHRSQSR